jgi:biotin transport system substrate-specific component
MMKPSGEPRGSIESVLRCNWVANCPWETIESMTITTGYSDAELFLLESQNRLEGEGASEKNMAEQIARAPEKLNPTVLLLIVWSVIGLSLASMVSIKLANPTTLFWPQWMPLEYSIQIPVLILIAGFLGRYFGLVSLFVYLVCGFSGLPVFSGGGGLDYLSAPSSGYLLGSLLTPFLIQPYLEKAFKPGGFLKGRTIWLIIASILAVMTIHIMGLTGLVVLALKGQVSWFEAEQWFDLLTWPSLIYDILFSVVTLGSIRLLRGLFWLGLY